MTLKYVFNSQFDNNSAGNMICRF